MLRKIRKTSQFRHYLLDEKRSYARLIHPAMRLIKLNSFLVVVIALLSGCTRRFPEHFSAWKLTSSDKQIWAAFEGAPQQPVISYIRSGNHTLRYWSVGSEALPVVLLVHGAPSSMVKYRRWYQDSSFYNKVRLVAVDRPGYGKSGYGKAIKSIDEQAKIIAPLVENLAARGPITLYGSSYGASVAARIAMRQPDKIGRLVLQSASLLPGAEHTPKTAYWIRSPLGVFFPKWARVATKEKFSHQKALEEIQDGWKKISCPVWVIHGDQDDLIFPANADHAVNMLKPHTEVHDVRIANARHNIFWRMPDTIKHYILTGIR